MYNMFQQEDLVEKTKKTGSSIHIEPENASKDNADIGDVEDQPECIEQAGPEVRA